MIVFFDDILVYNMSLEDHLLHLPAALEVLLTISYLLNALNVNLLLLKMNTWAMLSPRKVSKLIQKS